MSSNLVHTVPATSRQGAHSLLSLTSIDRQPAMRPGPAAEYTATRPACCAADNPAPTWSATSPDGDVPMSASTPETAACTSAAEPPATCIALRVAACA